MGKNHKSIIKKVSSLSLVFLISLFMLPLLSVEASTAKAVPIADLERDVFNTYADVRVAQRKLSAAFKTFLNAGTDSERATARTALDTANQKLTTAQTAYRKALNELTIAKSRSAESALSAASKASAAAKQAAAEAEAAKAQAQAAAKEIEENPNNAEAINKAAEAAANARVASIKAQAQARAACTASKAAGRYNSLYPSNVSGSAATSAQNSCDDAKEDAQNALTAANETEQSAKNKIQATHIENRQRVDSATKKIEKQRKFLGFSAFANMAVGAYLLNNQCNPTTAPKPGSPDAENGDAVKQKCGEGLFNGGASAGLAVDIPDADFDKSTKCAYGLGGLIGGPPGVVYGCYLGPAALAQGVAHMKQRASLKRIRNNLKGVTTGIDGSALYAGNTIIGAGTDTETETPGNSDTDEEVVFAIPDLEVPCMDDPTKTCRITDNGETIVPVDGSGPAQSISELAGNLPTSSSNPAEQAEIEARLQVLQDAVDANRELIVQAEAQNPNNDENSGTNDGSGFQAVTGNDPTPAFNFDPLGTGSESGTNGVGGAAGIAGNSGFGNSGGNTPELSAPPEGVYEQDGQSGSQTFAGGNLEGDSLDEENLEDADDESSVRFAGWGRRSVSGGDSNKPNSASNSLPFGTDRVATTEISIFGAITDRYQGFRDSGQFIPPSTSGTVVTPSVPTGTE